MSVYITNHARLRYLERIKKFSKEKLKACQGKNAWEKLQTLNEFGIVDTQRLDQEIIGRNAEKVIKNIEVLRNCRYVVKSHVLEVVDGVIVTVYDKKNKLFKVYR